MYVTSEPIAPDADFCSAPQSTGRVLPDRRVAMGQHIFREGDTVKQIYQVKSGVVRLARLLEDGRRQVIAFGYPGDIVGFPSLGCYHSDCDALTDTVLHPYRRQVLEDGGGDPALHRFLLDAALNEISAMQDHFMMLGRKSAFEKVASFLTALCARVGTGTDGHYTVNLPMTRGDIGDFLGLTTETVSRTLTQLRKSGVIEIDHVNTVVVLKPTGLLAMASGEAH
ncbi:MAG: helix-turn-helix domain-containing protein [Octadecabacter sp.]|nr:helix-turn-helix domain-containing protein [Octadecabacter sp.]